MRNFMLKWFEMSIRVAIVVALLTTLWNAFTSFFFGPVPFIMALVTGLTVTMVGGGLLYVILGIYENGKRSS